MASVKKIVNPLGDEGSQETFRTLSVLKSTVADLNQFIKLARAHHQAMQTSIDTGKQLVDHIVKLTTKMDGRLGDVSATLIEISSTEKITYSKLEEHNNVLLEKLAKNLEQKIQHERSDLQLFEKNFHKRHSELLAAVRKAEKETKKSGKKSPYQLQQAIQELTDRMNDITNHRQAKLEEILRMERKRYCELATMLTAMIDSQIGYYNTCSSSLNDQIGRWKGVANSAEALPSACQQLIQGVGIKERTSTAIYSGGDTGSTGDYYEGQYYEEGYEEGYDEGYYEEGYEEGYYEEGAEEVAGTSFKAKALYDYNGSHDYELSFKAGDIITVTNQDASSGWWTGELRGVVGPFPGNYVEKMN